MANFLIPGIYNYCDRWCERCRFINRCAVGQKDLEYQAKGATLFEVLEESFAEMHGLLQEICEREGLNMDELAQDPDTQTQIATKHELIDNHPLTQVTLQYIDESKKLRDRLDKESLSAHFERRLDLGLLEEKNIPSIAESVGDAISVIQFYLYSIHIKTSRAISGLHDDMDWEGYPRDCDGTAKLVTILVNRSMGAWNILLKENLFELDEVLTPLALLDRIHREILELFPNALNFVRPGFDTEN